MNHPIWKYTLKALFRNKTRTLFLIISNILCVAGIITFGTVIGSYYESYQRYLDDTYGTYDMLLRNTGSDTENELDNDLRILSAGQITTYGMSEIKDSVYDKLIITGSMDETAQELTRVKLISGRMPENRGEAAIEKSLCAELGIECETGTSISFDLRLFYPTTDEMIVPSELIVVGIIDDYSELQSGVHDVIAESNLLPNVLVSGEEVYHAVPAYHYPAMLAPGFTPSAVIDDYVDKTASKTPEFMINARYGYTQGESGSGNITVMLLLISTMAATVAMSLFFAISSWLITRSGRHEQIYYLKLAGISNKQLFVFLILNASLCTCVAIPVGIALGIIGGRTVSDLMLNGSITFYIYRGSALVIALSSAAAVLINIIAGIYESVETARKRPVNILIRKKPKRDLRGSTLKIKNPVLLWGTKTAVINTPRTAGIVLSFAICFFALFTGGVICKTVILSMSDNMVSDYKIYHSTDTWFTTLQIPMDISYGISKGEVDELINCGEVSDYLAFKKTYVNLAVNSENKDLIDRIPYESLKYYSDNEEEHVSELRQYGYDTDTLLYRTNVIGTDEKTLNRIIQNASYINGAADANSLKSGNSVIVVCRDCEKSFLKPGDIIDLTQLIRVDPKDKRNLEVNKLEFTVTVCAVVEVGKTDSYLNAVLPSSFCEIMWNEEAFTNVGFDVNYNYLEIVLDNPEVYTDTEDIMSRMKSDYSELKFKAHRENSAQREMVQKTVQSVYVSVTVMIAVFGVLSLFTVQRAKIQEQRRVWGALRAAGLERRHAYLYQICEITLYMLFSWVFALFVSCFCAYFFAIDTNVPWYTLVPWAGAFGAFAVFETLGILIGLVPMSTIFKKSIVGLISYE